MPRLLNENSEWQLFPKDFQKICKAFLSQTKLLTFLYVELVKRFPGTLHVYAKIQWLFIASLLLK